MGAEKIVNQLAVTDVTVHKTVPVIIGQVGMIVNIAGIGQCIQVPDPPGRTGLADEFDEIGADEPAPAGYQNFFHIFAFLFTAFCYHI